MSATAEECGPSSIGEEKATELHDLPVETLQIIMTHVPASDLLKTTSLVSGLFAHACEPYFEQLCKAQGWRVARRPRGEEAEAKSFPWRSLYRKHACLNCGHPGDFVVRKIHPASALFLLCKGCVSRQRVLSKLISENLEVDLIGLSGKKLLRTKAHKRKPR